MKHDLKELRDLEKRLAEANGPESYIDCVLYTELGSASRGDPGYPNGPTASLDAAVALAERVLPELLVGIRETGTWADHHQWAGKKVWEAQLVTIQDDDDMPFDNIADETADAKHCSPALALCLACVRALIAQGEVTP